MNDLVACKEILGCHNNRAMIIHLGTYLDQSQHMCGTGARHVGAPGKLIIWHLQQTWRPYLKKPAHTVG
jgi:hypothetical protein